MKTIEEESPLVTLHNAIVAAQASMRHPRMDKAAQTHEALTMILDAATREAMDELRSLRARAVELEGENRFLEWQLACAQSRWDDARRMEREGALDRQAIGRVMSNQTISARP